LRALEGFRRAILHELAARKGIIFFPADCVFSTQDEYDGLAALVRGNLDMSLIFRLLEHS